MSRTDELRALLDANGVPHASHDEGRSCTVTTWGHGGGRAAYREWAGGAVRFEAGGVGPRDAVACTCGTPREAAWLLDDVELDGGRIVAVRYRGVRYVAEAGA